MSNADKMFEELGYIKKKETEDLVLYYLEEDNNQILSLYTSDDWKGYQAHWSSVGWEISVREHLAIHEKLKELGWIE